MQNILPSFLSLFPFTNSTKYNLRNLPNTPFLILCLFFSYFVCLYICTFFIIWFLFKNLDFFDLKIKKYYSLKKGLIIWYVVI